MIAAVDAHYAETQAIAACVVFHRWTDHRPCGEIIERIPNAAPYEPGRFYLRELPCLLAVLDKVSRPLEAILIDGYVWLGDEAKPGLGAHLYASLGKITPVIGVAKSRFHQGKAVQALLRGKSSRPLFVSAAGVELAEAAAHVREMHGPFRVPTLLKHVDRLCRGISLAARS
ncbi:MAG TPA: endonuclease V [Candidatus Acidoferrales bacterium]|nr:endonuclease V [Candidatus Acidoferrales bacterium]